MIDLAFKEWPKIPRFFDSSIVVTEKIDGTNGLIAISDDLKEIKFGSRTRWCTPEDDNYGFARWGTENAQALIELLGAGYHYGEWWGQGVQRKYNMDRKVFSLFNVHRWGELWNHDLGESICDVVPFKIFELTDFKPTWNGSLGQWFYPTGCQFDEIMDEAAKYFLYKSRAAEKYGKEFNNPEGFCIFHERSQQLFKVPVNK